MKNKHIRHLKILLLIIIPLISLLMHYQHLDKDLVSIHVWRQTYTQNTIDNFYEEDFNILNPRINERGDGNGIYRLEFPLMQWMAAGLYKIFGRHILITRVFMWLIGLMAVWGMYFLIRKATGHSLAGLFGAWAFNFSPAFYYYTINPLPDLLALCLSIWGLAFFFAWIRKPRYIAALLSGIFLGAGSLCKLPFVLFFAAPGLLLLINLFRKPLKTKEIVQLLILLCFLILPAIWYITVIPSWTSNSLASGMFGHKVDLSTYLNYALQNLVSTLPESLLNYGSLLFFITAIFLVFSKRRWRDPAFLSLMFCGLFILAYFFYELNLIGNIHDYYLFPVLPLLFILVAYGAWYLFRSKYRWVRVLVILLLLLLPLTTWLRMKNRWDTDNPGFNKDLLIYKVDLREAVPHDALCIAGNDESTCIMFYYIGKKGWCFTDDSLRGLNMEQMIARGAEYLYSDSRSIETKEDVQPYLDSMIKELGSIRVYALKGNQE